MDNDMFSGLNNIFKPAIRQAEEADTHLYLRQHERDQNKKHSQKDKDDGGSFDMNDQASVSLEALQNFITNMLSQVETGIESSSEKSSDIGLHDKPLIRENNPVFNSPNARAAGAYAHAAETMPTPLEYGSEPKQPQYQGNTILHKVLKDIEILRARGVKDITIERAETFEKSLLDAIERLIAQT